MSFDPYLHFQGNCREAMTWYAEVFGGELYVMTYGDMPPQPDMPVMDSDLVMHACVTAKGRMLMASDFPPGMGGEAQQAVSISHGCDSRVEAEALFTRMKEGGEIVMPFSDTFWADGFGMLKDRFGTHWMIGGPTKM